MTEVETFESPAQNWKLGPLCLLVATALLSSCRSAEDEAEKRTFECELESEDGSPDSLGTIGCRGDFDALAAEPTDSSLPGALSVKTIIDRVDEGSLYFQNSDKYRLHYDFASSFLSAKDGLPIVADQESFNENYYSVQRRFYLGAVTYYEGPEKWVYEMSPYDTATAEMVAEAYDSVVLESYFGEELYYHPSGEAAEEVAAALPDSVKVISTDELYEGIDYQALNLGESCGRLFFLTPQELEASYVSYQDIVVLASVPNDISVAQGIITQEFQTPLSHVNVLSQNRGTPNMGLSGAFENEALRALEGKWVRLEVGAFDYQVSEITREEAEGCAIQPDPIEVPGMDLSVQTLTDIKSIYDPNSEVELRDQISAAVSAFGGKASHYSALAYVDEANAPNAFAVPVFFYDQFMEENGFNERVRSLLEDEVFVSDAATRDFELEALREAMLVAPINEGFLEMLIGKLNEEYANTRMRFRSSTNAEDLGDFTGAGLYTSKSGQPGDPMDSVEDALRVVWSSIWFFRAFEERAYHGIDHEKVGMALLVHRSFPDEEVNGVAATSNPFDTSGVEPGFYVNVQKGEESVVEPDDGVTTDQFIYHFDLPGQPVVFLEHSNLVPDGDTVLTSEQTYELGIALKAIHQFFYAAYGPNDGSNSWYAMDVEFKFDGMDGEEPQLFVKQARPYPGR